MALNFWLVRMSLYLSLLFSKISNVGESCLLVNRETGLVVGIKFVWELYYLLQNMDEILIMNVLLTVVRRSH